MTNFGTRIRKAAACILSFTCCAAMGFVPLQAAEVMPSPVEHYALAREAASEGVVLVKNEQQALPFSAGEKIAVFGMNQLDYVDGGGGAGYASGEYKVSLLEKRLLADGSYEELPTLNTDPEIAQIPAEGSLRIECENAAERGEGSVIQRYFDETGTLGTAVGYFNQGRWLTYPLQAETARPV